MKAVEEGQRQLLLELMQADFLSDYYLAGGTNLALRFGHRYSVDLDLFKNQLSHSRSEIIRIVSHKFHLDMSRFYFFEDRKDMPV